MKRHGSFAAALAAFCFASAASAQTTDAAQRAEARTMLARAVGFDTSEGHGQTLAFANYLSERFRSAGFPATDIHVTPLGDTASLVLRYRGDGSGGRPILLLAHMDVVPARREDWARDPFTMVEEDGYFFGRGVLDNKAGLIQITSTLMRMRREGFTPTRDLVVVLSGDEETSGATVQSLLRDHRDWVDAEFALNSDSGGGSLSEASGRAISYEMQTAEKTYVSFTLTARNPGGHSSMPRVDNAIYDLMGALAAVRAHEFPVMWNDTTIGSFRAASNVIGGQLGAALRRFADHPGDRRAVAALSRDPGAVGQIRTTCVPTLLEGGHAENALPQSAQATLNCRVFPGVAVEAVHAELRRLVGADIEVAQVDPAFASDASPLRPDVVAALAAALNATYPGTPISPAMSAGATDGVFFRAAGIPTYGVGGVFMKASDEFSHGLNERVTAESFYAGLTHWRVLISEITGRR